MDLKLVTQEQGRMELGEYLDGMITRDGEDHFTFVENDTEQRKAERRNPSIYMGQWINVKRRADGTVYPTFKRTKGIGAGKLGDYAVNTTCELLMVVGKHEAAMALAEIEGFDLSEPLRHGQRPWRGGGLRRGVSPRQTEGGRQAPEATSLALRLPRPMRIAKRKQGLRSVSASQCKK